MSKKFGLIAVGVDGEKVGALVSLENVPRYWRAFAEKDVALPTAFRNAINSWR